MRDFKKRANHPTEGPTSSNQFRNLDWRGKHPPTESEVEKELGVDKLELSMNLSEANQEMNKKILQRLASDAEKLMSLQMTVDNLRRKMEANRKARKPKNVDFETVKEQLQEVEETDVQLVNLNSQLMKGTEESSSYLRSASADTKRRRISSEESSEQARKGSEKIGRLQLEIQKIQYILLKLEDEKKSKARSRFSRSNTGIILKNFIHIGRRNSEKKKKAHLCCFRPSSSSSSSNSNIRYRVYWFYPYYFVGRTRIISCVSERNCSLFSFRRSVNNLEWTLFQNKLGHGYYFGLFRLYLQRIPARGLLHSDCRSEQIMATTNGDVLMLAGPPESVGVCSSAEVIDALPYIDDDYGDPKVKEEVDRFGRRGDAPQLQKTFRFPQGPPSSSYIQLCESPDAWEGICRGLELESRQYRLILHDMGLKCRLSTNAMMKLHGNNRFRKLSVYCSIKYSGWKIWTYCQSMVLMCGSCAIRRLEAFLARMQSQAVELNEMIEAVNRERKYHQQLLHMSSVVVHRMERTLSEKLGNQSACGELEGHIEQLKKEAQERDWNLEANVENGKILYAECCGVGRAIMKIWYTGFRWRSWTKIYSPCFTVGMTIPCYPVNLVNVS
uniref:NT3 n=1 Tax=Nicotiana tabacum TaxID=4097 RepID=Q9XEY9_TOBAC|nr:NT3 [Nicotiana tabacum]